MPSEELLQPDIASLARFNALTISETDFNRDMRNLVEVLESVLKTKTKPKALANRPDETLQDILLRAGMTNEPRDETLFDEAGFVFVCYAREDQEFAHRLAKTVKERGVRVWLDQWDIPASADWDHSIDEALF